MQITIPRAPGPAHPTNWPAWAVPVLVDNQHRGRIVGRTVEPRPVFDVLYQNGAREISVQAERLRVIAAGGAA